VEASLQHEAKATAHGVRTLFVQLKHRHRFVRSDIHSTQAGPVVRDSPTLRRLKVLSRTEGERWQVR
jgi:hypothetical protein